MKIPSKITKRQFTALNKKNEKSLAMDIESGIDDCRIVAHNLALNNDCAPGLDEKLTDGGYRETTKFWAKEMNTAFRIYIRDRNKIYKAYQKGLEKKC